jgi:hypothetical protein
MVMTRALILATVVVAFASPMAVQAGTSGSRTQTQPAPVQTHPAKHMRLPAMNHAPDVTLKRGAIGN